MHSPTPYYRFNSIPVAERAVANMEVQAILPEVVRELIKPSDVTRVAVDDIHATFKSSSIDLLSKGLDSRILATSDEWFAEAANLTTDTPPIAKPGVYTYAGAWMDGWETRRHNPAPFDWVVLRMGVASGLVKGVEIDTGFFNGNQAPEIAVEGCFKPDAEEEELKNPDFKGWTTILSKQECGPACRQAWLLGKDLEITKTPFTHIRLCMYPDGGIGRFRLYGEALPVFPEDINEVFDLAATVNGGVALRCSDQHFGTKDNLLLPGRGKDMGDGWETKRSRGVHIDWVIIRLGAPGEIEKIVVDTAHFRGNFPTSVQLFAAEGADEPGADDHDRWVQILAPSPCGPDKEHFYEKSDLSDVPGKVYGYIKMVIIPDGGVKRLRVLGRRKAA